MIEKIAQKYGIMNIEKIERLSIKSTNGLHKVKAENGTFLVKKLTSPYKKEENVRAQIEIAMHLHKKGVPTILSLKNSEGEFLTVYY